MSAARYDSIDQLPGRNREQARRDLEAQGVALATVNGQTAAVAPRPQKPPRQIVAAVPDLELVPDDEKKTARKYRQLEHIEQVRFVNRCLAMSAHDFRFGVFFAVPNANPAGKAMGGYFKAEGVRAGVPDMCFPVPAGKYPGCFIELKAEGMTPTEAQHEWHARLIGQGYFVVTAWGADEAWEHLAAYMAGRV